MGVKNVIVMATLAVSPVALLAERAPAPVRNFPDFLPSGRLALGVNYWASHAAVEMWRKWDAGEVGAEIDVTADMTIKALWKDTTVTPTTYKVTFYMNGRGTNPGEQTVEEGKTATKPADPTASGWKFIGWEPDLADTVTETVTYDSEEVELTVTQEGMDLIVGCLTTTVDGASALIAEATDVDGLKLLSVVDSRSGVESAVASRLAELED